MNSIEASPYRSLWTAVLIQAFSDLLPHKNKTDKPVIRDTGDPAENKRRFDKQVRKRKLAKEVQELQKIRARAWIFSFSTKPRSFLWVCSMLDLNPELFRSKAKTVKGIMHVVTGKIYEDQC